MSTDFASITIIKPHEIPHHRAAGGWRIVAGRLALHMAGAINAAMPAGAQIVSLSANCWSSIADVSVAIYASVEPAGQLVDVSSLMALLDQQLLQAFGEFDDAMRCQLVSNPLATDARAERHALDLAAMVY